MFRRKNKNRKSEATTIPKQVEKLIEKAKIKVLEDYDWNRQWDYEDDFEEDDYRSPEDMYENEMQEDDEELDIEQTSDLPW